MLECARNAEHRLCCTCLFFCFWMTHVLPALGELLLGSKKSTQSRVYGYTNESHIPALPRSYKHRKKWLPVLLTNMCKKSKRVWGELRREIVRPGRSVDCRSRTGVGRSNVYSNKIT
jgi:hypothetical protein